MRTTGGTSCTAPDSSRYPAACVPRGSLPARHRLTSGSGRPAAMRRDSLRPALPERYAATARPSGPGREPRGPRPSRGRRPGAGPGRRPPTAGPGSPRPRPPSWRRPGGAGTRRCRRRAHRHSRPRSPRDTASPPHAGRPFQPPAPPAPAPDRPRPRSPRGSRPCRPARGGRCRAPGPPPPALRRRGAGGRGAPPSAARGRAATPARRAPSGRRDPVASTSSDLVGAQAGHGIPHRLILPLRPRHLPEWRHLGVGRLHSGRRAASPVAGTVTPRALDPPAAQPVDREDGLARTRPRRRRALDGLARARDPAARPPSPPPGSTTSATRGGRSPSGASAPPSMTEARLHLPGRIRTRGEIQVILQNRLRMVDLWKRGTGRPARARARAHRGDRPRALGDHLAARAAGVRPRQPPAAAVGASAHRPLRGRLGGPVRRRDHAHGRDGARLHRHARERRPAADRVHLRLRPSVLERHVHRPLQRGRIHRVAQRSGPGPDLRLAQAPSADAAVGGPATDTPLGRQGALPPFRPASPLRDLPRRPRRDHPPRPVAGHRVAGGPHGDVALHALGPRRPRDPDRVHGDGARDADGPRHRRARRPDRPRRNRSPTWCTGTWSRTPSG